jgi:isopentenyldiphosphate isomerase
VTSPSVVEFRSVNESQSRKPLQKGAWRGISRFAAKRLEDDDGAISNAPQFHYFVDAAFDSTSKAQLVQSSMASRSSILSRIQDLDATRHASSYVGFVVGSECVGQVHRDLVSLFLEKLNCFQLQNEALHLKPEDDRTAAMDTATQMLIDHKFIKKRHSDMYPVSSGPGQPPLCLLNRNAAPYFGITSVGVHLLCYKNHPQDVSLWMAQRAANKAHFPSLWDPTVAGGQPANLSLWENVVKEAQEEAGVTRNQLEKAQSVSCLSLMTSKVDGTCLKQSLYYCWELHVDDNFEPTAVDGEVAKFELWNAATLMEEVQSGSRLRPAMRLVIADFLIRHGIITPDTEPDYSQIQAALHRDRLVLWHPN